MNHRLASIIASALLILGPSVLLAAPDAPAQLEPGELPPSTSSSSPPPPIGSHSYPTSASEVGITSSACPNWNNPPKTASKLVISTNGTTVENVFTSSIEVYADNVTLNCVKSQGGRYALHCFKECDNLTVTNSEFRNALSTAIYIEGTHANISESRFGGAPDGSKVRGAFNVFNRNWLECMRASATGHMDGMQSKWGSDNSYTNNAYNARSCPDSENGGGGSAAFFIEEGPHNRTLVSGNYFSGAGYTVRLRDTESDNMTFINNVIERDSYRFGPLVFSAPSSLCAHWEGNTYHDGGAWNNGKADDSSCDLPR